MKNAIVLGLAVPVLAYLVMAMFMQPPPEGPPPGGPEHLNRIIDEMKLTDKQKSKADAVLQAHNDKMRTQVEQNQEDFLKQLKESLGAEQFKEFERTVGLDRRGPGRPRGWDRPGALERVFDDMKLSEKQKSRAEENLEAHHEKMRRTMDKANEELLAGMKGVLSEKQLTQLQDELDRRPPPPGPPGRGPRGVPAEDLVERVMAYDKNKKGKVTKDDLPERMQYLIELGDTNKDGALDREELKALAAKLDREGPPRGPGGPPPGGPGRLPPGGPPPGGPGGPPPGGLERALDELKLTDKQKTKAEEVIRAHHDRMRKLFEQERDTMLKQMKEVLGEEEFKKFERAMENGRPGGPPPRGPGRRERDLE
jgi:Spy/CpxP family protein refolding chaperone